MPPTDFGNLFDDLHARVRDCRIDQSRSDASKATITFRSSYPHHRARYLTRGSTWTSAAALSGGAREYACSAPACLWTGGRVEIIGCTDSAGSNCPDRCAVDMSVAAGALPAVEVAGLPATVSGHAACMQSSHGSGGLSFEASWAGTAESGYPRAFAEDRSRLTLSSPRNGRVENGRWKAGYSVSPAWSDTFEGTWKFTFSIGADRSTEVSVQVAEHCLNAPSVFQVDAADNRTRVFDGATVRVGAASRMVIETGNGGVMGELAEHKLDPSTERIGVVFSPPVPSGVESSPVAWSETGTHAGLAYSSAQTALSLQSTAAACPEGERRMNGVCEPCPEYQVCENGSLETKKYCDPGEAPASASMHSYQACSGGSLVDRTECVAAGGTGTVSARVVTHKACVGGTTADVTACVKAGAADPADSPCPVCSGAEHAVLRDGAWVCESLACESGERAENGSCQPCPEYGVCENGSLVMKKHCEAGNPPESAQAVDYQVCENGTTATKTACVIPGGDAPDDAPCPPCAENERAVQGAEGEWACEPCPEYIGCNQYQQTESKLHCAVGDPPANSRKFEAVKCLAPSAAHQAAHPDGSSTDARGNARWHHSDKWLAFSSCGISEPTRSSFLFEWSRCVDDRTVTETVCVNTSIPNWLRPTNAPCATCPNPETQVRVNGVCTDCPAGERPVNGVCTGCPDGQRLVNGACEDCPKYIGCEGRFTKERIWCEAGDPPGNAQIGSYQTCEEGVTRNRQACVPEGERMPVSTPCAAACTDYNVCTASTASRSLSSIQAQRSLLSSREFCEAGNPPRSARVTWNYVCQGRRSVWQWQCIGEGGLASDPGDSPCPGDRCIEYDGCRAKKNWSASLAEARYQYCGPARTTAARQVFTRLECVFQGTPSEQERTVYYCVGEGGFDSVSDVPASQPCGNECNDYTACSRSRWTVGSNLLTTKSWCGATDAPTDAFQVRREWCNGGRNQTSEFCIGEGGYASDPGDNPCAACPSGQRMVNGSCEACPTYKACSGNRLVTRSHCGSGNAPPSASRVSYKACRNGSTVTQYACVPSGGSNPPDNPCDDSCPSGQRMVNGSCEACPTYKACSGDSLRTFSWCASGNPPASARRVIYKACVNGSTVTRYACVGDGQPAPADDPCDSSCGTGERLVNGSCEACPTYKACSGDSLVNRKHCASGNPPASARRVSYKACVNGSTVTKTVCVPAGRPAPPDSPCAVSCGLGERLVNGSCEPCPTYKACAGNNLVTKKHCGTGNPPASASRVAYQACVNGSTVTRYACVPANGEPPGDDPCDESCPSGQRKVNGRCEPCKSTETYCNSSGFARTRTINACADKDSRPTSCPTGNEMNADGCCVPCISTETYCRSGSARTRTINACADKDSRPASCPSGNEKNADGCCVPCRSTETYCSGGSVKTRAISGCTDKNSLPSSCPRGKEMNAAGCCVPCDAKETYCTAAGVVKERDIAGCSDKNSMPESCGAGKVMNAAGCCVPCDAKETYCTAAGVVKERDIAGCSDKNSLPESCGTGKVMNAAGCCVSCTQTTAPACTGTREGQVPVWKASACRYEWKDAADCEADETNDGWLAQRCAWDCVAKKKPADLATFSNFNISRECGADREGVVACSVTFGPSGGITLTDVTNTNLGAWGTPKRGVDFSADVFPKIRFSFTQVSRIRVGGSKTFCSSTQLGVMCSHMGGGWTGNSRSVPGGIFDITVSDADGNTLASGRVALRGGRAARETVPH